MGMCRSIFLFSILISAVATAQQSILQYTQYQQEYSDLPENDERALPAIRKSIAWAKKIHHHKHLVYAYEDAAYYSKEKLQKLEYSDSIIQAAEKTKDAALISKAFLAKGIIYSFNYRKYDKALDQYLSAADFADKTADQYLIYKIKYNIGLVKSYLGYHEEAINCFTSCSSFFSSERNTATHATLQFNNTRGFLNSLHQMSICYRRLEQWPQTDSLLTIATQYAGMQEFRQENAYFLKEKGIAAFRQKRYEQSVAALLAAAEVFKEKEEDAYLTVAYFYIGKNYHQLHDLDQANFYLKKVDSLFLKNQSPLPETRASYELLLKNTDYQKNPNEAYHYTTELLKADSILNHDLPYLSARLHREYDTKALWSERDQLKEAKKWSDQLIIISLIVSAALAAFLMISHLRQKEIRRKYDRLQVKLKAHEQDASTTRLKPKQGDAKLQYMGEITDEILEKLRIFEKKEGFINPNLTIITLAAELKVSKNKLSYVINAHFNLNFTTYLNSLRIQYITSKLNTDREYLKLKTPELARKCGMKSRQHFSRLFYEHNEIRPSDFIELRKKQLTSIN